ncbi:monocarboxylate transporter 7-like [Diadema setosum]|uniref:monocarboxylate transporter 7-like n=1 Tax=Diadema setosum TaxID=31175 RepID=UPI003B3A53D3
MMGQLRRHWGWVITLITFLHFFTNYGLLYSYGQLLVIFQHEFGRGATITGWLGTIPFGLTYLASPLSNALIARFQHRVITILGTVACFAGLLLTSFMPDICPMFFTFSLLYGLGLNFVTVSGLNIILRYFPAKNSARSVTMALVGCNTGLLAVNPLFYVMNVHLGWRNTVRIASAFVLVTGLAAASTYTAPNQQERSSEKKSTGTYDLVKDGDSRQETIKQYEPLYKELAREQLNEQEQALQKNRRGQKGESELHTSEEGGPRLYAVLCFPELWMIAVSMVACSAAVSFFYMSFVNFLISKGFNEETSAIVMTALGVSQVVGKALVAVIGDHLPFPKIFSLVIAAIIGAAMMGSLLASNTLIAILANIIISGVFVVSVLDTIPHAVSHQLFHPKACCVSWTVITSSMGSGYVVGALLGESIDRTGSYDYALYVCMSLFLASAFLSCLAPSYQLRFAPQRVITSCRKENRDDVITISVFKAKETTV